MSAHREVLNAPLLPRSCAKCCFGCIPAIDRSLAGGGEMAAGRDCASFNEFILLYPAQTACGYTISPSKENLSAMSWPSWATTSVPNTSCYCTEFTPACTFTLMTSGFVLENCQLCSVLKWPSCCIPQVWIQLSDFSQLLIISNEMKTLLFALLLINKRALSQLGFESRQSL